MRVTDPLYLPPCFFFYPGNMLKTPKGKLALIDFGSMADIDEDFRYGLFGLVMGLQNKDLKLVTENLLKVRDVLRFFECIPYIYNIEKIPLTSQC